MKTIKIDLLPEDFKNTNYCNVDDCALARATRRHFEASSVRCDSYQVDVYKNSKVIYNIPNRFTNEDYDYVKEQYENTKCDKIFQVTLLKR